MQVDLIKPKVISLFSGAGGLDIGFERAGFKTIFATDIWDIACQTLQNNKIAEEVFCGDIRTLDFSSIAKKIWTN